MLVSIDWTANTGRPGVGIDDDGKLNRRQTSESRWVSMTHCTYLSLPEQKRGQA